MAYQDRFYTIGTAAVQNGSAVVTGTGTGWETALIDGGVFFVSGGSYPILSVESETSLTLAMPYAGIDGSGLPYAIDRQRAAATSNIQMNDRLAQIIREISVGNIEEFNALDFNGREILQTDQTGHLKLISLAVNKLLNTDANGDILLSDITARARTLLAASTGAAMMTAMGGELFGTVTNGGVIWPNGEMEQWGAVTSLDSGGGAIITYPRAFGSISVFIPTVLTDWVGINYTPVVYQSWDWGVGRRTNQTVWCRLINGAGGSGPLTVGNVRWYARGKA